MYLQLVVRKPGDHPTLKFIEKTNPKNVVTDLRDARIGRARGNYRHFGLLRNRGRLQGGGGSRVAEDGKHVVLRDQLAHGRGALAGRGLVILRGQLNFLPRDPAVRIYLLKRQRDPVMSPDAELRNTAAQRVDLTQVNLGEARQGKCHECHKPKNATNGWLPSLVAFFHLGHLQPPNATSRIMSPVPQIGTAICGIVAFFHS